MAVDSPRKTGRMPVPTSPSQVIQRPANDSWEHFHKRGVSKDEAVANQPRKRPTPPSLDPPAGAPDA